MAVTVTSEQITTGNQVYNPIPALIDTFTILETYTLEIEVTLTSVDNFTDKDVWFNPSQWGPTDLPEISPELNPMGWFINTQGKSTGVTYPMTLIAPNSAMVDHSVLSATFEYTSATQATILVEIICVHDIDDFINGGNEVQFNKFRRTHISAPNDFANEVASFYSMNKALWYYVVVTPPEITLGGACCIESSQKFTPIAITSDSADGLPVSADVLTIQPALGSISGVAEGTEPKVFMEGRYYKVGDGVKTRPFYFSNDGGATARDFTDISIGDELYVNISLVSSGGAPFDIETTFELWLIAIVER